MAEDKPNIKIEIDLGDNGGQLIFHNFEQVEEWLKEEESYWQWLNDPKIVQRDIRPVHSQVTNAHNSIRQQINKAKARINTPEINDWIEHIKEQISQYYIKRILCIQKLIGENSFQT